MSCSEATVTSHTNILKYSMLHKVGYARPQRKQEPNIGKVAHMWLERQHGKYKHDAGMGYLMFSYMHCSRLSNCDKCSIAPDLQNACLLLQVCTVLQ